MSDKTTEPRSELALFVNWGLVSLTLLEFLKLLVLGFFAARLHDSSEGFADALSPFVIHLTTHGVFLPCCVIAGIFGPLLILKELKVRSPGVRFAVNLAAFASATLLVWAYLLNVMFPVFKMFFSVVS